MSGSRTLRGPARPHGRYPLMSRIGRSPIAVPSGVSVAVGGTHW